MMVAIFTAMFGALAALVLGWRRVAAGAAVVSLALAVHLFLWEIWSPETGFRMPWIQTDGGRSIGGAPDVG
jgi:hypothetical protein